ncbi:MAG: ABC transporter permease [Anaerolineae bacterium]
MVNYIIRRLFISFFLLIGVGLVSWTVIQLPPGDFAPTYETFLMNQGGMTQKEAEAAANRLRAQLGLDQPQWKQFLRWMKGIFTEGKFGYSFAYRRDVGELIGERIGYTLLLALAAHSISTLVGIFAGIYVAQRKYSLSDNIASVLAFVLASVPRFWIALVIIYTLVFTFNQHHITSFYSPEYALAPWSWAKLWDFIKHVWPVVFIAGLGGVARNMRVMRGNLLDVLELQYVTTARAKGLPEGKVINRHAVPNALHPIVAYQGTVLPYMLQGELEAAIVLGIPTLGPLFYQSLVNQDIYISGSLLFIYAVLIVLGNLLSDILLAVLDPRIRYS